MDKNFRAFILKKKFSSDFQDFQGLASEFQDFPGLENDSLKFQDLYEPSNPAYNLMQRLCQDIKPTLQTLIMDKYLLVLEIC